MYFSSVFTVALFVEVPLRVSLLAREATFLEAEIDALECYILHTGQYQFDCCVFSLRVGFVTGPGPLVERIVMHLMVSSMHSSAIAQAS